MKSKIKSKLAVIGTIFILMVGVSFPWVVSFLQDQWQAQNSNAMELTLTTEENLFEAMDLIGGKHKNTILDTGVESQRTQQAIQEKVAECFVKFAPNGLSSSLQEKLPMFAVSVYVSEFDKNPVGNVFWYCFTSGSEDIDTLVWVEEQTGLVVSFRGYVEELFPEIVGLSEIEKKETLANRLLAFCKEYYPVESVYLVEGNADIPEEWFRLVLVQEKQKSECEIPVRVREGIVYFNFYVLEEEE